MITSPRGSAQQNRIPAWGYACFALVALLSSIFLVKNTDLRVYWYGVNGFFGGTISAYGPDSGIGHPMEYRYPPVTYLLLYPLRWLPLRVAGFLWMLGAWVTAGASVMLAVRVRRLAFSKTALLGIAVLMLGNIVLAIRYGNVQPFVISWLFAALILSETFPLAAGILLALAVSFKIWPMMFLPWVFRRERFKTAVSFVAAFATLWALPLPFFGVAGYVSLLKQWYTAVGSVGTTYSELYYFPGQSLRGILLRYLTPVDPPLDTFPHINFLSLEPRTAALLWSLLALVLYSTAVIAMLGSDSRKMWAWDGALFLLYSLLEPYAVKSGLISIGPAVLTAACLYTLSKSSGEAVSGRRAWAPCLFWLACGLAIADTVVQQQPWQRYIFTVGLDFWTNAFLLLAILIWIRTPVPVRAPGKTELTRRRACESRYSGA